MEELISKLKENAGITAEQAEKVLETIKDYVKNQFPMMAGAVDKLFDQKSQSADDDFM